MSNHSEDAANSFEIYPEVGPEGVGSYFGFQRNAIRYFVELLCHKGLERGLVEPKEPAQIWSCHILNCAVLSDFLPECISVADIGNDAGLPGLMLAIVRPDLDVILIKSMDKRCQWLEWASAELDLDSVRVLRARAEDLHEKEHFPFVTARTVGNLSTLSGWVAPLVRPKGTMLFLKGESVAGEVEAAKQHNVFRKYHVAFPEILEVVAPVIGEITRVAHLTKHS